MNKNLSEVLQSNNKNYIFPFFWLHGEEEQVLVEELHKVSESGIKEICLESRPHPDFMGEQWWNDLDLIFKEAKKLGMKIWLLDDSHFPTGYANGAYKDKYPAEKKIYLAEEHIDALGPQKSASFLIEQVIEEEAEEILGVYAFKRLNNQELSTEAVNLSEYLEDGIISWDLPAGHWRIFVLYLSYENGGRENYLNPISNSSVQVLIDEVYEPHYKRYKKEFGSTFLGFFSDEPEIGNAAGYNFSEQILGNKDIKLPWSEELAAQLKAELEEDYLKYLPALWYQIKTKTPAIRYKYMELVSSLFQKNFSEKLGKWCTEHGVQYTGHVIEDQNAHSKLGNGSVHYFKTLAGQHQAGLDVVLQQILPGYAEINHDYFNKKTYDGEFFHFALAKMASSLAHLDSKKKGRTMCEIFGAYGWSEGLKLMKWLLNHMLVRGVNYFVPHAFSPKKFPDPDCPPHFYAGNNNPQFRYFKILMDYTNRLSHLFNGGQHIAPAAVLYHAEAEWAGKYMKFQKPARELMENQIDFDIIAENMLIDSRDNDYSLEIKNSKLHINQEVFEILIIPYRRYITQNLYDFIKKAAAEKLKIVFIDDYPDAILSSNKAQENSLFSAEVFDNLATVKLEQLAENLKKIKINEINLSSREKYLRYYHYQQNDDDIFMFFNEDPFSDIETEISLVSNKKLYYYDSFANQLFESSYNSKNDSLTFKLELASQQAKIYILSADINLELENERYITQQKLKDNYQKEKLTDHWSLYQSQTKKYPEFKKIENVSSIIDLKTKEEFKDFSGTILYSRKFELKDLQKEFILEIEAAYETVEVKINSKKVGVKLSPPYIFEISNYLKKGNNLIEIEVTNTAVYKIRDKFSAPNMLEPFGILGNVNLYYK